VHVLNAKQNKRNYIHIAYILTHSVRIAEGHTEHTVVSTQNRPNVESAQL